jgi:N-acetylglutamate synthase-like GNAT family acetyltransferase
MSSQDLLHNINEYQFEHLTPPQFPLAKKFYKSARYPSNIGREDEVYVVRHKHIIIATLKLVKLDQYLILRSMVVSPSYRRTGVGLFMLNHLTEKLNTRECWCFPFDGLETFYGAIGFKRYHAENSPHVIRQKYQQYFSQGKKIFIMKRD